MTSGDSNIQAVARYLMQRWSLSPRDIEEVVLEALGDIATASLWHDDRASESKYTVIIDWLQFTEGKNPAEGDGRSENMTAIDWNNKGADLGRRGRHQEAMDCFNKALAIDEGLAIAWYNKGKSLDQLQRYKEAINSYDKALNIDRRYVDAWYDKGVVLNKLKRHQEAIDCYDAALKIDSRLARSWHNEGSTMGDIGRFQEAVACFDKALEIDWLDAQTWHNKGIVLKKLGRYQEAIDCLKRFIELAPPQDASQVRMTKEYIKMLESQR